MYTSKAKINIFGNFRRFLDYIEIFSQKCWFLTFEQNSAIALFSDFSPLWWSIHNIKHGKRGHSTSFYWSAYVWQFSKVLKRAIFWRHQEYESQLNEKLHQGAPRIFNKSLWLISSEYTRILTSYIKNNVPIYLYLHILFYTYILPD